MRAFHPFMVLSSFSLLTSFATPCRAAACCGKGPGLAQRLGPSERASATARASVRLRFGAYHARGEYVANAPGNHDRQLSLELGWLVKPSRRVQVGMFAPAVITWRHLGKMSSSGAGLGDVVVTGRYDVIPLEHQGWLPPLALTLAATLPTGRPPHFSSDALLADATGRGVVELRPGIVLEQTWYSSWFAAASLSAGIRSPYTDSDGTRVELAPRLSATAVTGPMWPWGLSLAAGAVAEWEGSPTLSGRTPPNAARGRTAVTALATYDFIPHWTATLSIQLDLPIRGFGRNDDTALSAGLGLRHAWGEYD